jgi:hypothetical protein
MAKELAAPVIQSQLDALKLILSLEAHVTAQGLQHTDADRIAWRDLYATDSVGTLKGRSCWPAARQQHSGEQEQDQKLA